MQTRHAEFRRHFGVPGSDELLSRLRDVISELDVTCLANGSTQGIYRTAAEHGLITDDEYRIAARQFGSDWHLAE